MLSAPSGPVAAQRSARELDLERLRDEIVELKARLAQRQRAEAGLEGEIASTALALELQERRIAEARTARELAEEAAARKGVEVEALEVRLAELHVALRRRLADLYRLGRQGYLRPLFAIRARHQLLPGIRQLRFLARRDRELLAGYRDARRRLASERLEIDEQRKRSESWLLREIERRGQLDRLRRRQATLLARLRDERRDLLAQTATLSDKERKLANLIDFLYGRTERLLAGTPIQEFRGALDWPVAGRVVAEFGPRRDPRYGTRVPHNGLEMAVSGGAAVRCVFPGEVVFAAPFEGYGLTAVVHHPGRVFTLYAGLTSLRVARGDVLSLDQFVGAAGERFYFEIRVENRPENPRDWLR